MTALVLAVTAAPAAAAPTPGDVDTSFGTGGSVLTQMGPPDDDGRNSRGDVANAVLPLPGGGLALAGGVWNSGMDEAGFGVAVYDDTGRLDPAFGGDGRVWTHLGEFRTTIHGLVRQPDGKFLAAGEHCAPHAGQAPPVDCGPALVRYETDGDLDATFGDGGLVHLPYVCRNASGVVTHTGGAFEALAVQPDGRIVAAGWHPCANNAGFQRFNVLLARFDEDGDPDGRFGDAGRVQGEFGRCLPGPGHGTCGSVYTRDMLLLADGDILVAGSANDDRPGGFGEILVLRFDGDDGDLDPGFGVQGNAFHHTDGFHSSAEALVLEPDGHLLIAGSNQPAIGDSYVAVTRLTADGAVDTAYGTAGTATPDFGRAYDLVRQADGRAIVGTTNGGTRWRLTRLLPDGEIDRAFGFAGTVSDVGGGEVYLSAVTDLAIDAQGRLLTAGAARFDAGDGTIPIGFLATRRHVPAEDPDPDPGPDPGPGPLLTDTDHDGVPDSADPCPHVYAPGNGCSILGGPTGGGNDRADGGSPPPPTGGGPVADTTAPRLLVPAALRSVRMRRNGVLRLRLGQATEPVTGRVELRLRRRVLAAGAFRAPASKPIVAHLKLRRAARRAVGQRKQVRANITLYDLAGNATTRRCTLTIIAARR